MGETDQERVQRIYFGWWKCSVSCVNVYIFVKTNWTIHLISEYFIKSTWLLENSKVFRGQFRHTILKETLFEKSNTIHQLFSVQFSHSVMSDSLQSHESQHAQPPCPSPSSRIHSNSRPSSRWCHPAISSSVVPFSSCPQSLPASESFPMNQLVAWGGQSIRVSALASFLPRNTQGWSPLEWTGWISLQSKGLSRVFSTTTVQKVSA